MTGFKLAVAVMAAMMVAVVLSASAGAVDDNPDPNPPPTKAMPNLQVTAGSVVALGASEWEIRYTVANKGTAAAPAFHTLVTNNGGGVIRDAAYGSLAAGASRSDTIHIARAGCYVAVRILADSTGAVAESRETDNQRVAVGLTFPTCPTQPRYKVKAVSFHAVDESGWDWTGSDEIYPVFSAVGPDGSQHTTRSHVFGDIDTGDTGYFNADEGCLYISCSGGAAPYGMGFSIQLRENDLGEIPRILADTAEGFRKIGGLVDEYTAQHWAATAFVDMGNCVGTILNQLWADDLIGSQTYSYSSEYLASKLPAVGGTFTDTRTYSGASTSGGAVYTMDVAVTRVS